MRFKGLFAVLIALTSTALIIPASAAQNPESTPAAASKPDNSVAPTELGIYPTPAPAKDTSQDQVAQQSSAVLAGCAWDACDGKDPVAMGCLADSVILYEGINNPGELRYSPACRAAWTQWTHRCSQEGCGILLSYTEQFGFTLKSHFTPILGEELKTYRTAMASWNRSVKMCAGFVSIPDLDPEGTGGEEAPYSCSRWF